MGYTHKWQFKKRVKEFSNEVLEDVKKVVETYKDILQIEYDNDDEPIVNADEIIFNGIGENGYEAFYVNANDKYSNFCKTARLNYDLPVCEVLLILKHHYKENFNLGSDGFWVSAEEFEKELLDGEWNKALVNVKNMFGYTYELLGNTSISNGHKYYNFDII